MQAKDARCWTRQSVTSFDAPPVLSPHGCPKLCEAASSGDGLERLSIIAAAVAVVVCEWSFADTSFETLGDDGAATGGADCFCPMLCVTVLLVVCFCAAPLWFLRVEWSRKIYLSEKLLDIQR